MATVYPPAASGWNEAQAGARASSPVADPAKREQVTTDRRGIIAELSLGLTLEPGDVLTIGAAGVAEGDEGWKLGRDVAQAGSRSSTDASSQGPGSPE